MAVDLTIRQNDTLPAMTATILDASNNPINLTGMTVKFVMRALSIGEDRREYVYTVDPEVWGAKPHDLAALAAHHLGLKKLAVEHGALAISKNKTDERLKNNLAFYEKGL